MPINNQEELPIRALQQALHELQKPGCPHAAPDDHESEFPLGAHGREQVQAEPSPRAAHHRRLALDRPRRARMMIGADARLVSKEDPRAFPPGQAANPRIVFFQPALNFCRLLLIRSPHRALRGQPQLRQQPADRGFAQGHAKALSDHVAHHLGRPQGIGEFQLARIVPRHGPKNPPQRGAIQLRRSSPPLLSIQRTPTPMTVPRQPPIHGRPGDPRGLGDQFGAISLLHARDRTLPDCR